MGQSAMSMSASSATAGGSLPSFTSTKVSNSANTSVGVSTNAVQTSANAVQTSGKAVVDAANTIANGFNNSSGRLEQGIGRCSNMMARMTDKIFGQEVRKFDPQELSDEDKGIIRKKLLVIKNNCSNEFTRSDLVDLEVGDIVEFERELFSDFGIHTGSREITYLKKGQLSNIYRFERESIDTIASGQPCRVNNLEVAAHQWGLTKLDENVILVNAFAKLNMKANFNLIEYNSEHFVTQCRYGKGFSEQLISLEN